MNKYIPLSVPNFEGNEKLYVNDALTQGWVSTGGAYITKFEHDLAEFLHVENVAACQSGTSAIHLSLIESGIGPGDVVIVPSVTFIAAVNPVKYQFASPVFIDCDDSLCIDPIKILKFCEEECEWDGDVLRFNNSIVKAIIVVHVFGNMADMESIMNISEKYNITVIEDATEALGTHYTKGEFAGKYAGTIGHFGAYSFNGNKIITTGGGGAVTSNNTLLVDHMRFLSTQAKTDSHFYIHDEVGYNYRMTNLQAALGVAQLEELPSFISRKRNNYDLYKNNLNGLSCLNLLEFRKNTYSNKWFYSIVINRDYIDISIKDFIDILKTKGIETRPIWGLINKQLPYKNDIAYNIEKAPYYAERIINIPSSTQITEDDIDYICDVIKYTIKDFAK